MHELLLFASVPSHQHHELLQQLAGLTAMQPRHCLERHLIFKAYRKPGVFSLRSGASQGVQPVELQRLNKMLNGNMYYTQVVGPLSERDFGARDPLTVNHDIPMSGLDGQDKVEDTDFYDIDYQHWRLEFRDIPEAATRSAVTSRLMSSASLPRGDIVTPMAAWGYRFVCPCFFDSCRSRFPSANASPSALLRNMSLRGTFSSAMTLSFSCTASFTIQPRARRATRAHDGSYRDWSKCCHWIRAETTFYRLPSLYRMVVIRRQ